MLFMIMGRLFMAKIIYNMLFYVHYYTIYGSSYAK